MGRRKINRSRNLPRDPKTWKSPEFEIMAKRRLRQAKKDCLILNLGTVCAIKGENCLGDVGPEGIEFDHVDGKAKTYGGKRCGIVNESWEDLRTEIALGLIQPACRTCNASKH